MLFQWGVSLNRWCGNRMKYTILSVGILVVQLMVQGQLEAQPSVHHVTNMEPAGSGRIVFVGNSLVEEAGKYGILEWMLQNAWPEKPLTFRNLGWSGDTVEGRARSYISQPPNPYELLLQQIDTLKPDLVIVGYGNIEAYEGREGLEKFDIQLQKLIADIDSLGAQVILISTLPQYPSLDLEIDLTERNQLLELYAHKIREVAGRLQVPFIDIFPAFRANARTLYEANGIHLNAKGYYKMGLTLLEALDVPAPKWHTEIDVREGKIVGASGLYIENQEMTRSHVRFHMTSKIFPVFGEGENLNPQQLVVRGLKKGTYALLVNGQHILAASAADFASGVIIRQGPTFDMARIVQNMYSEIHDLYFWEYRPLNRTYLVGFRKYEQGQNSYELGLQSLFIERIEHKINQIYSMEPQIFEIVRINR